MVHFCDQKVLKMVQKDLKGSKRVLLIRSLLVCASQYFGIFKNNFVPKRVQFCVQKSTQSHFIRSILVCPRVTKSMSWSVLVCFGLSRSLFFGCSRIICTQKGPYLVPKGPQGLVLYGWSLSVQVCILRYLISILYPKRS